MRGADGEGVAVERVGFGEPVLRDTQFAQAVQEVETSGGLGRGCRA